MKKAIFFFALFLWGITIEAQKSSNRDYAPLKSYQTNECVPSMAKTEDMKKTPQEENSNKDNDLTIPLVFHIISDNNEHTINLEQISSQIESLNRDFSNQAERPSELRGTLQSYAELAADTKIRFCLASDLPKGEAINFYTIPNRKWEGIEDIKLSQNGLPPVDSDHYLNIWVAPLSGKYCGNAQMPGGPSVTDGIVIDNHFFGNQRTAKAPYNEGKTLTHLVGNYLGLYPLWGPSSCQDDLVEDTPIHNAPNFACSDNRHISTCDGYPEEMRMNFMDNGYDACMYMFTQGQKERMLKMLAPDGPRNGLLSSSTECKSLERLDDEDPLYLAEQKNLHVFPNPASQQLGVDIKGEKWDDLSINVYDFNGKLIYKKDYVIEQEHLQLKVNCEDWPDGIYIIQAIIGGESFNQKIAIANH